MEMFKTENFDEITFQSKGVVDTEIPTILVNTVQKALHDLLGDELEGGGWYATPVMTNPNLREITFGLLTANPPSQFKYVVSIKTKEYWDEIYNRVRNNKYENNSND